MMHGMMAFSTQLWNCCFSPLLSGSTLAPSPFPMWISILYTSIQCMGGAGCGYDVLSLRQINICRKVSLQVSFFRWRHFALPSMSLIFQKQGTFRGWKMENWRFLSCPPPPPLNRFRDASQHGTPGSLPRTESKSLHFWREIKTTFFFSCLPCVARYCRS